MKYYIAAGSTYFYRDNKDAHWIRGVSSKDVMYTENDRKYPQMAAGRDYFEFLIPPNDRNIHYIAVKKEMVRMIE